MKFNKQLARNIAKQYTDNKGNEAGLINSFAEVCHFLHDNPKSLSWRSKKRPSIYTSAGIKVLAEKYFSAFRKSNFPAKPGTVPDEIVSLVMEIAYDYDAEKLERIKTEHQHSMCAENTVGALLERYLDSVLRPSGWCWCCGDFVKAVDFVKRENKNWIALQIKNRDNSENSSSKAIREGTKIQKWFRSFSKKKETNWNDLPTLMQGYYLSEDGFHDFVRDYLETEKQSQEIIP